METFPLYGDSSLWRLETFPLYGDFTGTLLYGDFSSLLFIETVPLYGDSSLWRRFLFTRPLLHAETFRLYGDSTGTLRGLFSMEVFPLSGTLRDSSLWRLCLFTLYGDFSSLRGLFSMETFPPYGESSPWRLFLFTCALQELFMETFPLYGSFTGTLLMETFSSLRGLYRDSSLWGLFLFTVTFRGLFSRETFLFFSTETFHLYGDFTRGDFTGPLLYVETFPLYGEFTGTLWGLFSMETFPLYSDSSLWRLFLFTGTLRGLFYRRLSLYCQSLWNLLARDLHFEVGPPASGPSALGLSTAPASFCSSVCCCIGRLSVNIAKWILKILNGPLYALESWA